MEKKKIKDLGGVFTGSTPSKKDASFYTTNDIPFIKPSDLSNNIKTLSTAENFISENARKVARIIPPNCVLCTCIGIIGKVGINSVEATCNQQINYLIPDKNNLPEFIGYSLLSIKDKLEEVGKDSPIVPIINKSTFENFEIPYYSKEKQIGIVNMLNSINNAILLAKQRLSALDELVKSRFIEMFGDCVSNTKEWNTYRLSDVCDVRDGTHDSPEYYSVGTPLITSKNISSGCLDFSNVNLISEEDAKMINKRSKVDYGDILLPMIGTVGGAVIVDIEPNFCIKNVALIKFTKSNIRNVFVREYLNSDAVNNVFENVKNGGTQKFVGLGTIRNLIISVPPIELQNEFAEFVKLIDKSKFVCHSKNFLCDILTFSSSTIAYPSVVSIFVCPKRC